MSIYRRLKQRRQTVENAQKLLRVVARGGGNCNCQCPALRFPPSLSTPAMSTPAVSVNFKLGSRKKFA